MPLAGGRQAGPNASVPIVKENPPCPSLLTPTGDTQEAPLDLTLILPLWSASSPHEIITLWGERLRPKWEREIRSLFLLHRNKTLFNLPEQNEHRIRGQESSIPVVLLPPLRCWSPAGHVPSSGIHILSVTSGSWVWGSLWCPSRSQSQNLLSLERERPLSCLPSGPSRRASCFGPRRRRSPLHSRAGAGYHPSSPLSHLCRPSHCLNFLGSAFALFFFMFPSYH